MLEVSSYLARIGYLGNTEPTGETLRALHRAHMIAVPFENLDISLGRKITPDEDAILKKIVEQRRGGFCYELNGAFAALLRALGFQVTLLSARVARADGGEGPEFDHLALRVDLPQPWLADVGFGESFVEPLRLEAGAEQQDSAGVFRVLQYEGRWHVQKAEPEDSWKPQYSFSLRRRRLNEFAGMCHYHQTSPESSFTQKRICSRATPEGRITVSDMKLIVTTKVSAKSESSLQRTNTFQHCGSDSESVSKRSSKCDLLGLRRRIIFPQILQGFRKGLEPHGPIHMYGILRKHELVVISLRRKHLGHILVRQHPIVHVVAHDVGV
jgi:N-hydroxyarylamine O-acetyltransferase